MYSILLLVTAAAITSPHAPTLQEKAPLWMVGSRISTVESRGESGLSSLPRDLLSGRSRPGELSLLDCDGDCADLSEHAQECQAVFGVPICHGWGWAEYIHERDSVNDEHIPGDPELGAENCGYTHYWCIPPLPDHVLAMTRSAVKNRALVDLRTAIATRSDLYVELNATRSALQVIGTCPVIPGGIVLAHVPIDAAQLSFWASHVAASPLTNDQ